MKKVKVFDDTKIVQQTVFNPTTNWVKFSQSFILNNKELTFDFYCKSKGNNTDLSTVQVNFKTRLLSRWELLKLIFK